MDQTAREIMSRKLITVRMGDSVRTAYQIMQDRKIRHLPVTDEAGEIIGILSDRDLQRAMTPQADAPLALDEAVEFNESFVVRDFMAWPVRCVTLDVPVEEVAARMLKEKVSAFLVKGRGGAVTGIITTDDLLKLLLQLLQKDPGRSALSLDGFMSGIGFSAGHWV